MGSRAPLLAVVAFAPFALALAACNSSPAEPPPVAAHDAGGTTADAGGGPGPVPEGGLPDAQITSQGCFLNPTTYLQIINACTDAEAIDKQADLSPMNLADGGLQPLP